MPDKVQCSHLLVKHERSRNPVSRRTGESTAGISVAAAHDELKKYEAELRQFQGAELVEKFKAAANKRSDCGSFAQGGDLGAFGPGEMQAPFEQASFSLQVGQMSGIVDSDSGSHLILRLA